MRAFVHAALCFFFAYERVFDLCGFTNVQQISDILPKIHLRNAFRSLHSTSASFFVSDDITSPLTSRMHPL